MKHPEDNRVIPGVQVAQGCQLASKPYPPNARFIAIARGKRRAGLMERVFEQSEIREQFLRRCLLGIAEARQHEVYKLSPRFARIAGVFGRRPWRRVYVSPLNTSKRYVKNQEVF